MKQYKSLVPELYIGRKESNKQIKKVKITSSKDAYQYFKQLFDEETLGVHESVIAIFLNRSNNTIAWFKVSSGGTTASIIDEKTILKIAIETLASGIILAHNHPSGALKPSNADRTITTKIKNACSSLDIMLLDHLIITSESYFSFGDGGLI